MQGDQVDRERRAAPERGEPAALSPGFSAPPPASPPASPGSRFAELDAFRGVAVLMVVAYHYLLRYDAVAREGGFVGHAGPMADGAADWARPGLYGVHLFFMISGFVICWSLSTATGLRGFALSRFSRIYPAFWIAALATFAIVHAFGLPGREVGIGELAVNLTMLQDWFGVARVDSAYWSLTVELTFYAWAALLYACGQLPRAELFFLPAMALGVLQSSGLAEVPYSIRMLLIVEHAHLFAAGIVYYRIYRGARRARDAAFLVLTMACGFAIYPPADAALLAGFHVPFALAATGRLGWVATRPLTWLGGISYTLYLLHQNVGYVVIREVREAGGSSFAAVGVAAALVLVLAQALSILVERPASRALRRRLGARPSPSPSARAARPGRVPSAPPRAAGDVPGPRPGGRPDAPAVPRAHRPEPTE